MVFELECVTCSTNWSCNCEWLLALAVSGLATVFDWSTSLTEIVVPILKVEDKLGSVFMVWEKETLVRNENNSI